MSNVVFITRFSLSRKTAIGVQTRHLMAGRPNARHLFWEQVEFERPDQASHRLERLPVARFSTFKGSAPRAIQRARCARTWWPDGQLSKKRYGHVAGLLAQADVLYLAPIGGDDAARMRQLVEMAGAPFIVHLWDMLSGGVDVDPDLRWLVEHAAEVFCLSQEMQQQLAFRQTRILRFMRAASGFQAQAPVRTVFRLGMIGDVASYPEGMGKLADTVASARAADFPISACYMGPSGVFRRTLPRARAVLDYLGFLESDEDRDSAIASCHAAFLPGPSAEPNDNPRSRYSVPSRVLDYMATGLPILGFVHPDSATGSLLHQLGIADGACCSTAEELLGKAIGLTDPEHWRVQSARSLAAFHSLADASPAETLWASIEALQRGSARP